MPRFAPRFSREKPTVVLSDERASSRTIAKFSEGDSRWDGRA
jgi:hypothetical protein